MNTNAMTACSKMLLLVASILLPNVCACCAVKVHAKDTPKQHKILTILLPSTGRSRNKEKWRPHGEDGDVQVWSISPSGRLGRTGVGGNALEVEDSKTHGGRVATSIPKAI